jgi:hypothetical protein
MIIIFIIIITIIITSVQCIYNYIPETNHVSTVYSAAAVLYLQSVLRVMLFPMANVLYLCISTSRFSAQCGCFLQSLNFVLARYVVQVLSE